MDEELLYNFNRILLEKREEIIEIANSKKREKKMSDVNKLNMDISTTFTRIKQENEKKLKNSARYKKKENI
jgi:hypothetical protein